MRNCGAMFGLSSRLAIVAVLGVAGASVRVPIGGGVHAVEQSSPSAASNGSDARAFQDLRWRNVGPTRGGRVTAIAGVRSQPCTFYMGATGGGVWKTENCGDRLDADQRRPDRDRIDRLHRCLGIEPERRLGRHRQRRDSQQRDHRPRRVQVDRRRADVAVHGSRRTPDRSARSSFTRRTRTSSGLAALGSPFGPNDERGIFKTTDGGKTWKKTLFVNNETGGRVVAVNYVQSERALRRDVSRLPQRLGHHQRRAGDRGRHLQVDRTAARPGRSCRAACRSR